MKRKMIITADDYGITPLIDDAIEKAITAGVVTSIAALPNSMEADDQGGFRRNDYGIERLKRLQDTFGNKVSIGLHFNITDGPAFYAGPNGETSSLIRGGKGKKSHFFKPIYKQMNIDTEDLKNELRLQIDHFHQAGIHISHFSDHYGIISTFHDDTLLAMIEVIQEYELKVGRRIPMRNPLLTSKAFSNDQNDANHNCLAKSKLERDGALGIVARGLFSMGASLAREFDLDLKRVAKQVANDLYEFNRKSIRSNLRIMKYEGMLFPDYFVDKYFKTKNPERALTCIIDHLPTDRYLIPSELDPQAIVAEVLVHLASEMSLYSKAERKLAKAFGFRMKYLKKGRKFEFMGLLENHDLLLNNDQVELAPYPFEIPRQRDLVLSS